MLASIIIPIYNGEKYLKDLIKSIINQNLEKNKYELILIDSSSTDNSSSIIKSIDKNLLNIKYHKINKEEYNHGGTRNFGASISEGQFLVYLTQDALPTNSDWLSNMILPMQENDRVMGVFGNQVPRQNHNVLIRRDIERHFDSFKCKNKYQVQSIDIPLFLTKDQRQYFSNVNSGLRMSYWKMHPFKTVDYCEDQLMGRNIIENNYLKAYSNDAKVYHSHNYSLLNFLKRNFDEYRGLEITLGYKDGINYKNLIPYLYSSWKSDIIYINNSGISFFKRQILIFYSILYLIARRIGAYLGSNHNSVPSYLYKRLSLEGKIKTKIIKQNRLKYLLNETRKVRKEQGIIKLMKEIKRYIIKGPIKAPTPSSPLSSNVDYSNKYFFDFILLYNNEIEFKHSELNINNKLIINWIIPDLHKGSGGHLNIFRVIRGLEELGHQNNIYIMEMAQRININDKTKLINDHFVKLEASIFKLEIESGIRDSDVLVVTSWQTAYPGYIFENTKKKVYFIQDLEYMFYPQSSEYVFAENTYKMNYKCITAGKWLFNIMSTTHKLDSGYFHLSYDPSIYRPIPIINRQRKKILFYARHVTPRRGFELGILALKIVKNIIKDAHIVFIGWDCSNIPVPFEYENKGILNFNELAALYNEATLGLVLSLTNYSMLPQEMIACGLPVIDIRRNNTETSYDKGQVILTEPNPISLADKIVELIRNPEKAEKQRISSQAINSPNTLQSQVKIIEDLIYKL